MSKLTWPLQYHNTTTPIRQDGAVVTNLCRLGRSVIYQRHRRGTFRLSATYAQYSPRTAHPQPAANRKYKMLTSNVTTSFRHTTRSQHRTADPRRSAIQPTKGHQRRHPREKFFTIGNIRYDLTRVTEAGTVSHQVELELINLPHLQTTTANSQHLALEIQHRLVDIMNAVEPVRSFHISLHRKRHF